MKTGEKKLKIKVEFWSERGLKELMFFVGREW